mgnify:CR=1 FL=1
MRLLILTQYYPPEIGAPQNRLHELAIRLQKYGIEVEVLTALPNYPTMKIQEEYRHGKKREEEIDGKKVWRLALTAKVDDATYHSRKLWVEQEHFVPIKEDLFAKSGQLLKRTIMSDIKKVDGRWYPHKMNYKDMLKDGKGTDFVVTKMQIDVPISDNVFNKSNLKK